MSLTDFLKKNAARIELLYIIQVIELINCDCFSDLVIVGKACRRLLSGMQKTKLEEQKILESLRSEGLIARSLKTGRNATG